MIHHDCYEIVGDFDESFYPAWHEDNDYHVRMHRAGIKAVSIDLPYLHHGSSTVKNADPAEQASFKRGFEHTRGLFKLKYGCYPTDPAYNKLFTPLTPLKLTRSRKSQPRKALINQA